MNTLSLTRTFTYARDALSGLGILYLLHLTGWANMTVTSLQISPEQAHAIQGNLEYDTEVITPKRRAR